MLSSQYNSTVVIALAWSSDGKRIASAAVEERTVQVWSAKDGKPVFTYGGHSAEVETLAWSPDSQYVASGSLDKTVQVWRPA
jgi:WD40 repeat protein